MRFLPESEEAYYERIAEEQSFPVSEAEADRYSAHQAGAERPEQAWILSDRDVWYANPAYRGPRVPHPEDYSEESA